MRILIAEDDSGIAQSLKKSLEAEHHQAEIATDGEIALEKLEGNYYDALLLDWRMPKVSGLEVCRALRTKENPIPIILLTALTDISNKVEALNVGADDYITKPFSFDEVLARLNAILRRSRAERHALSFGEIKLDLVNHLVKRNEESLKLPEMEFELLRYLVEHRQQIVNKEQLARDVWKLPFLPTTNFIEATVKNLRKKLGEIGAPKYIKTIYGEGYSLIDDED
jgi:DNA-binding response OmpR family regulator